MFFQVLLYDSRRHAHCPPAALDPCSPKTNYYFKTNPFGFSVSLGSLGAPCLSALTDDMHAFNVDVAPFLKQSIHSPPPDVAGMDTNLTNWRVTGFYIGAGLQGSVTHTLVLGNVHLVESV